MLIAWMIGVFISFLVHLSVGSLKFWDKEGTMAKNVDENEK